MVFLNSTGGVRAFAGVLLIFWRIIFGGSFLLDLKWAFC